jgi:hypothetical protein
MTVSSKGGEFERDTSRVLSLWWTGGEREDIFWRTSASGARAKSGALAAKQTKYEHGDITFTDPTGTPLLDLLVIEAKRGYTNTSRKIKKSDMQKVCEAALNTDSEDKVKAQIQRLFSRAKKGGGVSLLDLVDSKGDADKMKLLTWVVDAEVDRSLAGVPYFWLIGRRDGHNSFILMPESLQAALEQYQTPAFDNARRIILILRNETYYITAAKEYFEWLLPQTITLYGETKPMRRYCA